MLVFSTKKVIAEQSGHQSLKALKSYEKIKHLLNRNNLLKKVLQKIDTSVNDTDKKPSKAPEPQKASENLSHTFSRTLNNCTINIHRLFISVKS